MSDKKGDSKKIETDVDKVEINDKTCFVIMPIADTDDYAPNHFSRVYEFIIKPACKGAGFTPALASNVRSANLIFADILKRIISADMVVCDLSSRNPNVLYELAIRQCFDLPVVLIKDDKTRETFDIQGIRYIEYDKELRIDLVSKAIESIVEAIKATLDNKEKDIFSLVQILGRDKAATKVSEVSPDTLAILEAIRNMESNYKNVSNTYVSSPPTYDFSLSVDTDVFSENVFTKGLREQFKAAYNIVYSYHKSHTGKVVTVTFSNPVKLNYDEFINKIGLLSPNITSYGSF